MIINLTPHAVDIQRADGTLISVPPSGTTARVAAVSRATVVGNIAVTQNAYGEIEGLPPPAPATIYIVSALVMTRAGRVDVLAPGEAVRDEAGRVVACRGLSANPDMEIDVQLLAEALKE